MSDSKTERLINLTLALLASKRYLTKSEIYSSVAGYEGSAETKERMFERDKDDLRSLGIDIEVGDLDPFFQDEPGYRITYGDYALDLGELTPADVAILSIAADIWQESSLSQSTHSALRKLHSLGIPADFSQIAAIDFRTASPGHYFETLLQAIEERRRISFRYQGAKQIVAQKREVEPFLLTLWRGFWYLIGLDGEKNEIRTFKLNRVQGEIQLSSKKKEFSPPKIINPSDYLSAEYPRIESAKVLIHAHSAFDLRKDGVLEGSDGDWDKYSFAINDLRTMVEKLLPFADKVIVLEPQELRTEIVNSLTKLVSHG